MRPPVFGYVRISSRASEHVIQDLRKEIIDYAEREGYVLTEIFTEHEEFGPSAFAALMDALKRSETAIVVVPGRCHFAHFRTLRAAMRNHIERETGARVIVVSNRCADDRPAE